MKDLTGECSLDYPTNEVQKPEIKQEVKIDTDDCATQICSVSAGLSSWS